jgi:hypothetical protein
MLFIAISTRLRSLYPLRIHEGDFLGSDLNLFSRRIAMKLCGAAFFERACRAIAVLKKLNVRDFAPHEARE